MWQMIRQFLNTKQYLYYIGRHDILPPPLKGQQEKEIIEKVSKRGGTVISTGGGVICDNENVSFLKGSGIIFYIKRDIEKIANQVKPDGRPLFKAGKKAVKKLFKERQMLYESAADYEIENNSLPKEAAEKICDIYRGVEK